MILYTVKNGVYYNLEDFKEDLSDLGENGFPNKIYINMTNRCSCSCTFCLRSLKEFNEHNSLWLKEEPSIELVKELFSKYDWSHVMEIIFCGFGEPTMRFDDVVEVVRNVTRLEQLAVTSPANKTVKLIVIGLAIELLVLSIEFLFVQKHLLRFFVFQTFQID